MNTRSFNTFHANAQTITRKWFVVDAEGQVVGRLCSKIASILRGKHKVDFTPHVDCGDYVIVLNADKVRFTGNKMDVKEYITFSGYPGGQKRATPKEVLAKNPERIVEVGVRKMLPKNRLGDELYRKLYVYTGTQHPHQGQTPETLKLD